MNFHHSLGQDIRGAGVAETETGHCVGFGKSVKQNSPFAHVGQAGDADVIDSRHAVVTCVGELAVDLVTDDD